MEIFPGDKFLMKVCIFAFHNIHFLFVFGALEGATGFADKTMDTTGAALRATA
jgi:hypothetical protein